MVCHEGGLTFNSQSKSAVRRCVGVGTSRSHDLAACWVTSWWYTAVHKVAPTSYVLWSRTSVVGNGWIGDRSFVCQRVVAWIVRLDHLKVVPVDGLVPIEALNANRFTPVVGVASKSRDCKRTRSSNGQFSCWIRHRVSYGATLFPKRAAGRVASWTLRICKESGPVSNCTCRSCIVSERLWGRNSLDRQTVRAEIWRLCDDVAAYRLPSIAVGTIQANSLTVSQKDISCSCNRERWTGTYQQVPCWVSTWVAFATVSIEQLAAAWVAWCSRSCISDKDRPITNCLSQRSIISECQWAWRGWHLSIQRGQTRIWSLSHDKVIVCYCLICLSSEVVCATNAYSLRKSRLNVLYSLNCGAWTDVDVTSREAGWTSHGFDWATRNWAVSRITVCEEVRPSTNDLVSWRRRVSHGKRGCWWRPSIQS